MTKTTWLRGAVIAAGVMVAASVHVAVAEDKWQVGTAPSASTGKYGTGTRTGVVHTPFTARRLFDAGDVTLVVPFTCVSGDGSVTVVDGTPVRNDRPAGGAPTRGDNPRLVPPPVAQSTTACGFGDVIVRGRYYLLDERGWLPTIALRGHIKAPTASAERGLGTGRPDEGIGIEVSRMLAGGLIAMVDGGYTIIGEPADADYDNNWWYDVGVGRDLANGVVNLSVFFAEDRAIVSGLENARDVLIAVSLKGTNGWRFQVAGQFGLSDGAPEQGLSIGASRRF